ncbi:hypothetical protein KP509_23G063700 [Ceratopteris richardii]|uniref:Aminotransferase class I/classII large domain-containing protein n=1 Tax=Ceratopteris richardii TaxID=49495 RepID=A0A8T2S0L5_CERRI|nr:hypothetical protein KP509_23G063700 [Ceratopteris richardii]
MRIIVPLQGVVQGRGGVFWGSVIPCGLFYLLQLYIRQRRPNSSEEDNGETGEAAPSSDASLSRVNSHSDVSAANNKESTSSGSHIQLRSPRRPSFVSHRAITLSDTGDSAYYIGWREYYKDPYHATDNPNGIIQLGLAENTLSLDLLQDWLSHHPEASMWNEGEEFSLVDMAPYQYTHGIPALKAVLSDFLGNLMKGSLPFYADNIVVTAGATAALEILAFCLGDAGDSFLVPSPYYPGFDRDIKWKSGIQLVPVYCPSHEGFKISKRALEKAYNQSQREGSRVRAVLITTPGNPVGSTLDAETIQGVLDFARKKGVHVISDEIYAASVFKGEFVSASQILASGDYDPDFVHIVYGLSKDFGIPGFRVGLLYSTNEKILAAARNLTRFCTVSSYTQKLLVHLFKDKGFIERFLEENRQRLKNRHETVLKHLEMAKISCADSNGGLYVFVDLRHLLTSSSVEAENDLWKKLLYEVKVSLSPASACHYPESGWFRLCFANLDDLTLVVALERLCSFIKAMKK